MGTAQTRGPGGSTPNLLILIIIMIIIIMIRIMVILVIVVMVVIIQMQQIIIVIIVITIIIVITVIVTVNLPTNIVGFRGFDSNIILIIRGGISRPIGNCPESLSQAMLVGIMLVGRLGVSVMIAVVIIMIMIMIVISSSISISIISSMRSHVIRIM